MPRFVAPPDVRNTQELSQLAHEVSLSVENASQVAGPSATGQATKRMKHMEKAKVQQLTRQLAMRLQYAKLKVDHGWTRQNLNEVENLYFHHHRATRPPVPQTITRRAAASSQKSRFNANYEPAERATPAPTPQIQTKIGSDPTVYSVDPSGTAPLPPPSTAVQTPKATPTPANGSSSSGPIRALPVPLTSAPPPARRATVGPSNSTPTPTLHQSSSFSALPVSTPTTASQPYGGPSTSATSTTAKAPSTRTPKTSTAKSRAATAAAPTSPSKPVAAAPRVTIIHNKNTSTPSTLAPPLLSVDSNTARLAATGSSTLTTTGGPTSYESFWSSLSSSKGPGGGQIGLGLRTSALNSGVFPSAAKPVTPAPPPPTTTANGIPTPGLKALARTGSGTSAGGSFTALTGTTPYPTATMADPNLYHLLKNPSAPFPASRAMPS